MDTLAAKKTNDVFLQGVDHIAHVTWKPAETYDFYHRILGLPLVHAVTATGWVTEEFPDFVHFFFELGKGNHLAFFYYFGLPEEPAPDDTMHRSRHLAFHVETEDDLKAWRQKLKELGVRVTPLLKHEILESIYFDDPNGIQLEIARLMRPFGERDIRDAHLTIKALSDVAGGDNPTVQGMWARKAELVKETLSMEFDMPAIMVLNIPEFEPIIFTAKQAGMVARPLGGYVEMIADNKTVVLERRHTDLRPALWFAALTAGVVGNIDEFNEEILRISAK